MADALTVVQAPFVANVSGAAGIAPSVVDLGSYNLTLNLSRQVAGFLFAPASTGSYFDNLNSFVAVASSGHAPGAQSISSRLSALRAYANSLALAQQESPAELYLRQLLSQPPPTFQPASKTAAAAAAVQITADKGETLISGGAVTISRLDLAAQAGTAPDINIVYGITGGPSRGHLELASAPGVAISSFTQADINQGLVQYVNDGTGAAVDSFTFTVRNGPTGQAKTGTFNLTVAPPLYPPQLTVNAGATVAEGGSTILTTAQLSASDADTSDQNLVYNVTGAPLNGHLELTTNPGAAVTKFTQADLANGLVRYVHNGSETTSDSFSFSLSDGYHHEAQQTFNISVTPVDDAPVLATNNGTTVAEGGTTTITTAQLNTTDVDTSNASLTYTVTSSPANGYLQFNSNPGVAITSFTQADLAAGKVQYVHNGSETTADSFNFTVADQTTTLPQQTFNIGVTPVDDAPVLTTDSGATVNEGSSVTLTTSNLNATDVDTSAANLTYNVTSAPTNGYLQLSSNPGVAITSFTQADLAAGEVQYIHNGSETTSDAFSFSLTDGTTALAPANFNITVNPVDDAPSVTTNNAATVLEGGTVTLTTANLNATDPDTSNGNLTYTVTGSPANGYLQFASNPSVAITSFTQADLAAGRVQYVHNGSETTSDFFTFRLSDGTTTLSPANFNINVTPVDDPPVLTTDTGATVHVFGTNAAIITTAQLSTSDVDTSASNLTYSVTGGLTRGYLELTTSPGVHITSFTQADLQAGIVEYVHTAGSFAADNFTFTVKDQTTTLSQSTFTFSMTV